MSATPRPLRDTAEPATGLLRGPRRVTASLARNVAASLARRGPVRRLDGHPGAWLALGVLVLAWAAWHVVSPLLVTYPDELWQIDLEVYREAAHSLVTGRQVYDWLTDAPQYLPFTYPPFAALLGVPMLLLPFRTVGWVWTVVQVALLWFSTGLAFRPLLERAGARRGLVQGGIAAALIQLEPLQDSIRYGQVNAVLVALCLADVARRRVGWWPRGSLVGLAAAVKLTPAVFWVHWLVLRRWRTLAVSVGTALTATVLTALFAPSASLAYWSGALLDPDRLGPNASTANQSIRGVLLRIGPPKGPLLTLSWALCVLVVGYLGFRLAARLERLGEPVAVVATLGMLAFLLSPVSWIHHMYWGIVAIGALLGDARRWLRIAAAAGAYAVMHSRLPWTGQAMLGESGWRHVRGVVDQQAYCWLGLGVLAALWLLMARGRSVPGESGGSAGPDASEASPGGQDELVAEGDSVGVDDAAVAGAARRPS